MSDLIWFIVLGLGALGGFIFYLIQDAKKSQELAGMHQPAQPLEQTGQAGVTAPGVAGGGWLVAGWVLAAAGVIGLVVGLLLDTSVAAYSPTMFGGPTEVVNLDLLFRKGVVVACGIAAIAAGIFCLAVAAILRAIHSRAA
ncbi:MAG TPA: hypothetical protein VGN68_04350 [Sphingopyxis sp.]|jgi:hypothetical protein|uniref:hypothetical protein n=1 Tax=Sphingopyxis sp. TaxID=1908224 RepID=UPI002E0FD7C5|nr:hypothetical protein [Sphingopyxis sp.]